MIPGQLSSVSRACILLNERIYHFTPFYFFSHFQGRIGLLGSWVWWWQWRSEILDAGAKFFRTYCTQRCAVGVWSTLIVRNCALSASQVPITVTLKAAPSFPACAYDYVQNPHPVPDSWGARDVSTAQGTLEVSLVERISEGRIGVTYSTLVISATANDGSDITNTFPKSVCLKFAKPQ